MMGLAVAAHTIPGGALPVLPVLVGLTALIMLAAAIASLVRLPFGALLVLSGLCQQFLHLAFAALAGSGHFEVLLSPVESGHHQQLITVSLPSGEVGQPTGHPHSAMLLLYAHTAAAVLGATILSTWSDAVNRVKPIFRRSGRAVR